MTPAETKILTLVALSCSVALLFATALALTTQ